MKKVVILLLFAAMGKVVSAQVDPAFNPPRPSESLFRSLPGSSYNRFDFMLPNNNRMIIEPIRLQLLEQLPNLDSTFKKVWEDLLPIYDSLTDPLKIRRIDYVNNGDDIKIGIKQYTSPGTYYSYKDDELVQLKMDQDTLRFRGYIKPAGPAVPNFSYWSQYYTITLILNNLTDVTRLQEGILQSGLEMLLADLKKTLEKSTKKTNSNYYYALYDMKSKRRVSPRKDDNMGFLNKHGFAPYVELGIQYARGAWLPSAGAGIEYYYNRYKNSQYSFKLLWEPYFYFQRDDKDKIVLQRNDFLTLKFQQTHKNTGPNTFEFNQNFSFGALVYRKGELFEKGTFKFTLPGLMTKNILIEPEFFFNKLFRNFSPSLKLTVDLD